MNLSKVISGGQTGADTGGLMAAKRFGIETGGWMPKGFKTLAGPRPYMAEKYSCKEHTSDSYAIRTELNVKESDATVRFAGDFSSRGEICTLNAIKKYKKPYFDVDLSDPPEVREFLEWLEANKVLTLNVAGNSEQTFIRSTAGTYEFLVNAFFEAGMSMRITDQEILASLGIKRKNLILTTNIHVIKEVLIKKE
jgi:predicted Rossmann-fold nucleotide-binding protein